MITRAEFAALFLPSQPVTETVIRGTVMYLSILVLFRLLNKEPASLSVPDLLVLVLIADAAQNGMAGSYTSILDGIILVCVILLLSWLIDVLAFKVPFVSRLVHPPPLLLVKDGRLISRNLRKEFISKVELMSQLREQGIEDISQVKRAYVEGDGRISVITASGKITP